MSEKLDSFRLTESFLQGAKRVIEKKQELNNINIFPVADGDTGSNLSSLMQAILDNAQGNTTSISNFLNEMAEASLLGARGNSGLIFAQYLSALAENYPKTSHKVQDLINALNHAVNKAYSSLIDPREGTILSVMRAWSNALLSASQEEEPFREALLSSKLSAKKALTQTQFQIKVLKQNQLVDSGAMGFYYFVEGFTETYCSEGKITYKKEQSTELVSSLPSHFETVAPTYRYCSEFILKNPLLSSKELQNLLEDYGDSLVIIGNSAQLKIHLHVHSPEKILQLLEPYGEVTYQKVDDMQLQYDITKHRKASIALVTDSIADLPSTFLNNHQINVLPMNIMINDQAFLDKLTIRATSLENKLVSHTKLSTAQPTIRTVDALLSFLEEKYEHVLVVTVSSKLSGTNQLINQRIKEKQLSPNWIRVIDSKLNSAAQGLLVQEASKWIETGMTFESLIFNVEKLRERIFIYVAVEDLSAMISSGRIPAKLGKIAQKLSLHPIITLDSSGNGRLGGLSFSQEGSMKKIKKKIDKLVAKNKVQNLAITHAAVPNKALQWREELLGTAQLDFIVESSTAIAISAGIGSIAIAGIQKEKNL